MRPWARAATAPSRSSTRRAPARRRALPARGRRLRRQPDENRLPTSTHGLTSGAVGTAIISKSLAPGAANEEDEPTLAYRDAKARFDADYYERLLRAAHGNVSLAAKLAQKTRKEVYDALRRAGVDVESYRDSDAAPSR